LHVLFFIAFTAIPKSMRIWDSTIPGEVQKKQYWIIREDKANKSSQPGILLKKAYI
jgi:hypothetical protein